MHNAKLILESANRYNKAQESNNPVDQAVALNEFRFSLNEFVLEVLKEQKKQKNLQAKASYRS